jgi:hypothetical protein
VKTKTRRNVARKELTRKEVYTMVFYNQRISQTQAPVAAAQDTGASIRQQLIKRHVMLEEDIDAARRR